MRLPHTDLNLQVAGPGGLVPPLGLAGRLHLSIIAGEVNWLGVSCPALEAARRVPRGEGVLRLLEEHGESELRGVTLRQRVGEEATGQVQAKDKARWKICIDKNTFR